MSKLLCIILLLAAPNFPLTHSKNPKPKPPSIKPPPKKTPPTPPPDDKILQGFNCSTETYSYLVGVYWFFEYDGHWDLLCGGTLLGASWVLTAAHCLWFDEYFGVRYQLSYTGSGMIQARAFKHFKYVEVTHENDIGLLRLTQKIAKSDHVSYVKLPKRDSGNDQLPCERGLIMGWGVSNTSTRDHPDEKNLQCAYVPLLPLETCAKKYASLEPPSHPLKVYPKMVCTWSPEGKDACHGDSGGPLMCGDTQVGIVSFGEGCGVNPNVYIKVDRYLKWMTVIAQLNQARDFMEEEVAGRSVCVRVNLFVVLVSVAFVSH